MTGHDRQVLHLATGNPGKVAELTDLLGHRYEIRPRPADLVETVEDGDTLEANAVKKAREVTEHTGGMAVSDDSGLFVDALGGGPGVRTGRFAGESATDADNRAKLLDELAGVEPAARAAAFRTVMAVMWPDGRLETVEGAVHGRIAIEARGDGGFGYDPLFLPDEAGGLTFAEMGAEAKHAISHRGRAVAALLALLEAMS
jgi:XTP/dITP diphosphohydrolase